MIDGRLDGEFPLVVFQTGSGTQTEHERQRGDREPGHPDRGGVVGSNEADPSQRRREPQPVVERHLPDGHAHRHRRADRRTCWCRRCACCATRWRRRPQAFAAVVMVGRTHLAGRHAGDARAGDRRAGSRSSIRRSTRIARAVPGVHELAIGGTAVGTGLNAPAALRRRHARAGSPRRPASRSCRRRTSSLPCRRTTRWST